MKYIIDMPEDTKQHFDEFKGKFLCGNGYDLIQAIKDSKPLHTCKSCFYFKNPHKEESFIDDDRLWGTCEDWDYSIPTYEDNYCARWHRKVKGT